MIKFLLWYLATSTICSLLYVAVMVNYANRKGEW